MHHGHGGMHHGHGGMHLSRWYYGGGYYGAYGRGALGSPYSHDHWRARRHRRMRLLALLLVGVLLLSVVYRSVEDPSVKQDAFGVALVCFFCVVGLCCRAPPPAAADGEVVAHDNTAPLLQGEVLVARAPGEAEPLEAVVLHVEPPTAEAVQAYAVEEPVATDVSDANPF